MTHDLIIKNAKTIKNEPIEVAITNGKIVKVAEKIEDLGKKVIDLNNEAYISAGWIDDHVHCFEKMTLYYDFPDEIGVKKGVTTVIDAGTTGAENIHEFYDLAQKAKTNVYALVNISKWGIVEQDELADLSKVKEELVHKALVDLPDFVVGIKARMSRSVIGDNGITPLEIAKKIQRDNNNIPLMVHIGSAPPELDEILDHMSEGDVLTHCFNGKTNGILDQETKKIKEFAWAAYDKGVAFDIGHGTESFDFEVAEVAFKEGMKAESISTDIYIRNRENGPVHDLATTMEKMRVVGYNWNEIIEKVTNIPAKNFHFDKKGQLVAGFDGDITIFTIHQGSKTLTDSNGCTREANELITPVKTIIGGIVYDN